MVNQEISRLFGVIADALEFKGENRFRVLAYRRGVEAVADLDEDLTVLAVEDRLTGIPGIGKGLAGDIRQYLSENRMDAHDRAMEGIPPRLFDLKAIGGLGPKRLALLYRELGVTDVHSLRRAMDKGRVAALPGMGEKVVQNLRRGMERLAQSRERMSLGEALSLARDILAALGTEMDVSKAVFAGSLRRGRETCGDLDLLIPSRKGEAVVRAFTRLSGVEHVLAAGDTKGSVLVGGGRQVDLRVVPPESLGAALCYFTGSKEHSVRLREIAKRKGLKVNEYGVYRGDTVIAGRTEKEVYAALDLPWIPPEMREDRGEIEAARKGTLPAVVEPKHIRGDLHLHTTWSNGKNSVLEMARAARDRGYAYIAVTDHSPAATYANGLSPERWREQAAAIEAARRSVEGLTILHGMEVDIAGDGTLDLPADAAPDWVVAAVHSGYRRSVTERMLRAMDDPRVRAVAHPTGRLVNRRSGYEAFDLDAIMDKAAATGVALEVNAAPDRLDLSAESARRAAGKGATLVINTGAHSVEDLGHMDLGVQLARRAWLTRKDILNTRAPSRLRPAR
jgi:DNA polymerase (family 10)